MFTTSEELLQSVWVAFVIAQLVLQRHENLGVGQDFDRTVKRFMLTY
jgi:hypothetical protein